MYTVVNSNITGCEMYRSIFKVSFYFRGSLYEIIVLMTLFLLIEVSILSTICNLQWHKTKIEDKGQYRAVTKIHKQKVLKMTH